MNSLHERWTKSNYISLRAMREWQVLVRETTYRLERLGITEVVGPCRVSLSQVDLPTVIKVCTGGNLKMNSSTGFRLRLQSAEPSIPTILFGRAMPARSTRSKPSKHYPVETRTTPSTSQALTTVNLDPCMLSALSNCCRIAVQTCRCRLTEAGTL